MGGLIKFAAECRVLSPGVAGVKIGLGDIAKIGSPRVRTAARKRYDHPNDTAVINVEFREL